MKRLTFALMILFYVCLGVILYTDYGQAGELDAWEFNIMGINAKDFQNRNWRNVCIGFVSSYVVHEAGHLVTARLMNADSYFNVCEISAYAGDGYDDWSNDQKALYHGGGYLFQTVVGGILTAIPKTRHSDFTLGFNLFSFLTGTCYGATGGIGKNREEGSDVINLDKVGYNGTLISFGSGAVNGVFTWISLDKD